MKILSGCRGHSTSDRSRHPAASWNATPAGSVQRSVGRTASVRLPVQRTHRRNPFAVATDRRTTTSASYGSTLVVTRQTWSRRPSATAKVGSLSARRTGRFIFCVIKLTKQLAAILKPWNSYRTRLDPAALSIALKVEF